MNWFEKAKGAFINSLQSPLSKSLYENLSKEYGANIVFIGLSQVGKTTFILRLSGVKQDRISELNTILRACRQVGQSSSSTATIYSRSDRNDFSLRLPGTFYGSLTKKDLKDKLAEVRKKVENREFDPKDRIEISIPNEFFVNTDTANRHIKIIDLPGLEGSNENERIHAAQLAARYLPLASLIFLVQNANNLERLHSIKLPNIYNWKQDPERFIILLSHSISPFSIRDKLERMKSLTRDQYLQFYFDSFSQLPRSLHGNLYPLEAGDSWDQLRKNHKTIAAMTTPILENLFAELEGYIYTAYQRGGNPYAAFLGSANRIESIMQNNKQKTKMVKKELVSRIHEKEKNLAAAKMAIAVCETKLKKCEKQIADLKKESRPSLDLNFSLSFPITPTVVGFHDTILDFEDTCIQKILGIIKETENGIKGVRIDSNVTQNVKKILNDDFKEIKNKLNKYRLDRYYRNITITKDKDLIKVSASEARKKIKSSMENTISYTYSRRKKILVNNQKEILIEKKRLKNHHKETRESLLLVQNKLRCIEEKFATTNKQLQSDFNSAKTILTFLVEHLTKCQNDCRKTILNKKISSPVRFLYLAYLNCLQNEFQTLTSI